MASSKKFLLQECANVKDVLDETLRYKYGKDGSKDFYDECSVRLAFTRQGVERAAEDDFDALAAFSSQINDLTKLIARIERSSIGEYSWPFVEELKEMATAICTEATLFGDATPPKIHVLSEGGLGTYAIDPEANRPSGSQRKILTIILPRTLKHYVLLHPILGHEIGHAIWANAKHQSTLKNIRKNQLSKTGSVFESPQTTASRLYSGDAPFAVRQSLIRLRGIDESNIFKHADWDAWLEELLCDLIGLLTFGPSFVAAACHLLHGLDPTGVHFGPAHPPVAWRLNMLLEGANILKYDRTDIPGTEISEAVEAFWTDLKTHKAAETWSDVFTRADLEGAISGIEQLLTEHPPAIYPNDAEKDIERLFLDLKRRVPPAGFHVDEDDKLCCPLIDFRHILYAGWVYGKRDEALPIVQLNRLCEHAIMQQRAIKTFNAPQ